MNRIRTLALRLLILPGAILTAFPGQLFAEVSDGAHGGNEHFFFLPPIVPAPSPTGTFLGSLDPVVQVCEYAPTGCIFPPVVEFTTTTGKGSERLRVVPQDEQYVVNFDKRRYGLNPTKTYRVRVLVRIQEGAAIEKQLGYADLALVVDPIKFRIEEGAFPIGELTPSDRAKISPALMEQFASQDIAEPIEALVNVVDDQIALPALAGVEILTDYRPTLAKVFVRIADQATLAALVRTSNVKHVYENRKLYLLSEPWQESVGQPLVQMSGYIGTGTAVAIIDDGGKAIGNYGARLPDHRIIDLSVPAFGGCTDIGTPDSCHVVAEANPYSADPYISNHATYVARRIAQTAPGANIVAFDGIFEGAIESNELAEGIRWVLENRYLYNIVALNMSFSTDADGPQPAGPYSTENCPKSEDDDFQRLRQAGIMPIAGAGNDGWWQEGADAFYGIGLPACSPFVVGVGGSTNEGMVWDQSTRGANIDLLAPAIQEDGPDGTSLSAPVVAAAWAILRAARPTLTLEETLELLKTTGIPTVDPESGLTFPVLRLDAALRAAGLPVVVYDNGVSTRSGGSAVGHFIAADDFKLAYSTTISGASVDVHDGPADQNRRWDGTVEWWLYHDNSGVPGNLIASGAGQNVEQSNIVEDALGYREFTVDFEFGDDISVAAGETIWLALHMRADYNQTSVFWDHQGSTVGHPSRVGGELVGGIPNYVSGQYAGTSPFDKAFRVWAK